MNNMAINGTWGTDTEMCVLAHLLNAVIFTHTTVLATGWHAYHME